MALAGEASMLFAVMMSARCETSVGRCRSGAAVSSCTLQRRSPKCTLRQQALFDSVYYLNRADQADKNTTPIQ